MCGRYVTPLPLSLSDRNCNRAFWKRYGDLPAPEASIDTCSHLLFSQKKRKRKENK